MRRFAFFKLDKNRVSNKFDRAREKLRIIKKLFISEGLNLLFTCESKDEIIANSQDIHLVSMPNCPPVPYFRKYPLDISSHCM